jgi:hypothetical protein
MTSVATTTRASNPPATTYEFARPVLTIRKGRQADDYAVREFACGMDGRAFRLSKDTGEHYSCMIARNGQDHLCECRGFEATGHCKHLDVMLDLVHSGEYDEADTDRPCDVWPSPQQLADEAGEELPF